MRGVFLFGDHGDLEGVFLLVRVELHGIVATVGASHAAGEGAGLGQFQERRGVAAVFLLENPLGAQEGAHVTERGCFRIGASRIALELGLIGDLGCRKYCHQKQ